VRAWLLCNILVGGKIVKELPGLVGSGTPYIIHTFRATDMYKSSCITNQLHIIQGVRSWCTQLDIIQGAHLPTLYNFFFKLVDTY
jgi:hypothetical protein